MEQYETDGYEREWLRKGYYHGYVKGVLAICRHVKSLWGESMAKDLLKLTLGEPKIV